MTAPTFVRSVQGGNNGVTLTHGLTIESSRVNRLLVAFQQVNSSTDSPIYWRPTSGSNTGRQVLTQIGTTAIGPSTWRVRLKALVAPTPGNGVGGAGQMFIDNPSSAGFLHWIGFYEGALQDIANVMRGGKFSTTGVAPADPSLTPGPSVIEDLLLWSAHQGGATNNAAAGVSAPYTRRGAFTNGTTAPGYMNVVERTADAAGISGPTLDYTGSAAWSAQACAIVPAVGAPVGGASYATVIG